MPSGNVPKNRLRANTKKSQKCAKKYQKNAKIQTKSRSIFALFPQNSATMTKKGRYVDTFCFLANGGRFSRFLAGSENLKVGALVAAVSVGQRSRLPPHLSPCRELQEVDYLLPVVVVG